MKCNSYRQHLRAGLPQNAGPMPPNQDVPNLTEWMRAALKQLVARRGVKIIKCLEPRTASSFILLSLWHFYVIGKNVLPAVIQR